MTVKMIQGEVSAAELRQHIYERVNDWEPLEERYTDPMEMLIRNPLVEASAYRIYI
jgi:hypothetical protein